MSDVYIGTVTLMAIPFAPRGWHACDGSLLSISTNQVLFSLIGTIYGGNGSTTFALPDLRGRVPVCAGSGVGLSNYVLGQMAGTENVTLTAQNIAPHTHTGSLGVTDQAGRGGTVPPAQGNNLYTITTVASGQGLTGLAGVMVAPNSGGSPFSILQPYLALNYYIALQGMYPVRN